MLDVGEAFKAANNVMVYIHVLYNHHFTNKCIYMTTIMNQNLRNIYMQQVNNMLLKK